MKLFAFQPKKSTAAAFTVGVLIVMLSAAMALFRDSQAETVMNILFRDILMIFMIGFCFPLLYVQKHEPRRYEVLGITKQKLKISIILNVIFGCLLLILLASGTGMPPMVSRKTIYAVSYILAAGVFEMVCIYGFMRHYFEKAFGIIPAILLTALFYSLHHAGFQPEFMKLFFVGIMYCAAFYITRNIFIIFPFFWGAGAIWDVLFNSPAGQSLQNETSFMVAVCLFGAMIIFIRKKLGNVFVTKNKSEAT